MKTLRMQNPTQDNFYDIFNIIIRDIKRKHYLFKTIPSSCQCFQSLSIHRLFYIFMKINVHSEFIDRSIRLQQFTFDYISEGYTGLNLIQAARSMR